MITPSFMPSCKAWPHCAGSGAVSELSLVAQFPLTGNATLRESLAFVKLSKASAYKFGIVPMINDEGLLIEARTPPPFPWTRMPLPITQKGKKLFDAAEIRAWRDAMRDRSRQTVHSSVNGDQTQRKAAA